MDSKKLPIISDRNFPQSFFVENSLRGASSNDSLRQSNDSLNLDKKGMTGPIRGLKKHQARQRKESSKKGRPKAPVSYQVYFYKK